jgi:hypothetical protein
MQLRFGSGILVHEMAGGGTAWKGLATTSESISSRISIVIVILILIVIFFSACCLAYQAHKA